MVKKNSGKKHFTIPVFIPGEACPFQCIFCDQRSITGTCKSPGKEEITGIIEKHLATFSDDPVIEAGFFGGTFTGLPAEKQLLYLGYVVPYIKTGRIKSIRISTRPDYIDRKTLELLRENHVKTIELGVQSFDNGVLAKSGRGHTAEDSVRAAEMILDAGFSLGLQMMVGLPGDAPEKVRKTASEIVRLGAAETRIYPVLVIRNTELEEDYLSGKYSPLRLDEAVDWTKQAMEVFESSNVKVIRVGLHHEEGFIKDNVVAGPVHPSFKELVMTEIWYDRLLPLTRLSERFKVSINVHPEDINNAVGYYGKNRKMLKKFYKEVKFVSKTGIVPKSFHADHYR